MIDSGTDKNMPTSASSNQGGGGVRASVGDNGQMQKVIDKKGGAR